jgi:hypothetical protein
MLRRMIAYAIGAHSFQFKVSRRRSYRAYGLSFWAPYDTMHDTRERPGADQTTRRRERTGGFMFRQ